jgi:hypothetical protein
MFATRPSSPDQERLRAKLGRGKLMSLSNGLVCASGLTSTIQLHLIPILGIYPSVCLLSGCASVSCLRYLRQLYRYPWFQLTCVLFVLQAMSLFWSPNHRLGIRDLIYQVPFIFLSLGMAQLGRKDCSLATRILKLSLAATAIEAAAVIVFKLSPDLKLSFLGSTFAQPFTSANELSLVGSARPVNVMDPVKSGGFFVNANPSAAFLGLSAMLAWYLSRYCSSRLLACVAVLDWAAVFFTGSKAGGATACTVLILMLLIEVVQQRRLKLQGAIISCVAGAAIVLALPMALDLLDTSRFFEASADTLDTRQVLWSVAQEKFWLHPFAGLGFGGWEKVMPPMGRYFGMPPHNAFIYLWAQSGVLAALAGFSFVVTILWWTLERAFKGSESERIVAKGLFAACLWLFIQAQGENFGIFGDEHMKPLLALTAGFLAALRPELETKRPQTTHQTSPQFALATGSSRRSIFPVRRS